MHIASGQNRTEKTPDSGFFTCDLTNTGIMSSVPKSKRRHRRDRWLIIAKILNVSIEQAKKCRQDQGCFDALVDRVVSRQCNSMIKITDRRIKLYCTVPERQTEIKKLAMMAGDTIYLTVNSHGVE